MDYEPIDEYDQSPATKGDLKNLEKKLTKRIDNLENRFDNLETRFDGLEEKFDKLYNLVDGFAGQVKTYNEERSAEAQQLSTITSWAKKVGEKIGIPIEL